MPPKPAVRPSAVVVPSCIRTVAVKGNLVKVTTVNKLK